MDDAHPFPRLRWLAVIWLAVYLPAYAAAYGTLNFLFLCNLGVLLTAVALWRGSPLLLSSQALTAPVICGAWILDLSWRLATGHHLIGATEYMWDPQYPLFTRLLSLYHVGWPIVLFVCLRRAGYDRRGFALQAAVAGVATVAARFTDPAFNINCAHADPLFHRSWGPAPLHLAVILGALIGVIYGVTHLALSGLFGPAAILGRGVPVAALERPAALLSPRT